MGVHARSPATGSNASCPASGSRMMPEKKPDAALFGLPGRTQIVGRRMPTPSRNPLPVVIGEQQFAHRFLRAVGGERRQMEFVGDRGRERRAKHRDRRGEHEFRMIAVAGLADGFEQMLDAVEIDAIALVEIESRLRPTRRRRDGRSRRARPAIGFSATPGAGRSSTSRVDLAGEIRPAPPARPRRSASAGRSACR